MWRRDILCICSVDSYNPVISHFLSDVFSFLMSHFILYISNFSFYILYLLLSIFYFLFLFLIFHFSFFICVILGSITQGDFRDVLQEQLRAGLGARDLDDLESGYRDPEDPRKVSISYLLAFIIVFFRMIFHQ